MNTGVRDAWCASTPAYGHLPLEGESDPAAGGGYREDWQRAATAALLGKYADPRFPALRADDSSGAPFAGIE